MQPLRGRGTIVRGSPRGALPRPRATECNRFTVKNERDGTAGPFAAMEIQEEHEMVFRSVSVYASPDQGKGFASRGARPRPGTADLEAARATIVGRVGVSLQPGAKTGKKVGEQSREGHGAVGSKFAIFGVPVAPGNLAG